MKAFANIFRFFIYSNLFIACCAVLMLAYTSSQLLHQTASFSLLAFVFFATISSYSFHWYLTPAADDFDSDRIEWLSGHKDVHLALFIVGILGAAFYGFKLYEHWPWLIFAAVITFLYSAPKIPHPWFRFLRKIAIGKTIFLAGVWMFVTSMLPLAISDKPWQAAFTLFCINRFFLIYAICILFDYRDREYDISVGIRSLITKLSERQINWLFAASILIFLTSSIAMSSVNQNRVSSAALIAPGLITAALYPYAKNRSSDMLYYFILDGLMAFSALIYYVSYIWHER